jgi:hypothetical protein
VPHSNSMVCFETNRSFLVVKDVNGNHDIGV